MYTCSICHALNHASRFHCSACGTIPACYSVFGIVRNTVTMREVVVARGAVRAAEHHLAKVGLKTVASDYYAEV